jgi:hypothetical protein
VGGSHRTQTTYQLRQTRSQVNVNRLRWLVAVLENLKAFAAVEIITFVIGDKFATDVRRRGGNSGSGRRHKAV